MSALFALLWFAGGVPAAVLSEVVRADDPRIVRAGRIAFAFLLAFDLLLAAAVFSAGADSAIAHMTRSLWWATIVLAGVPLALVSGFGVRRAYSGHRLALTVATLTTAALYLVFPLGFIPATEPRLTGLGRWAHDHHLLGIAILLIPTLILLVDELRRRHEVAPVAESDAADVDLRIGSIPRRNLFAGAIALLFLIWIAGTNGPGLVLGLGVGVAVCAVLVWRRHRSELRRVLRELGPPDNS